MNAPLPRARYESYLRKARELRLREERKRQSQRGGLIHFVRYFWRILEPKTPLVDGWPLHAICAHLEAVTFGDITRLLMNVPPGFMKSLLTDVLWPAWEWSAMDMPHTRYVAFSYASSLTLRDNGRFRDLLICPEFQELWGTRFTLRKIGEEKVTNDKTGWKLASSVGGVGTGERGDRVIVDDPHNVKESESDKVRGETVRWFEESIENRLNDLTRSAIIVIMQRVHEADVSGAILAAGGYVHLCIRMEFEPQGAAPEAAATKTKPSPIGWKDPRRKKDELAWPARFDAENLARFKARAYMWAGQYQQRPEPRGGGIIKRAYWQDWPAEGYPACEFTLASLDTAYTEKKENCPSGLTIWGVFRNEAGEPRVMLKYAWEGWLELHKLVVGVNALCTPAQLTDKASHYADIAEFMELPGALPRFAIDRLIIEGKASGLSVAQELRRLYGNSGAYGVEVIDPTKWGDKIARMWAVQHIFSDGLVHAPKRRKYAEKAIGQLARFPRAEFVDIADSTSMALRYLRAMGFLVRREEFAREQDEAQRYRRPAKLPYT